MFGYTIIRTEKLNRLRQDNRALDAVATKFKRDRDEARANLAIANAKISRMQSGLRNVGKKVA